MTSTAVFPLSMPLRPAAAPTDTHRNFLFILPHQPTEADHRLIATLAQSMTGLGFVYVASIDQTTMEDRGQVRYMPFRSEHFPAFGQMDMVFVLRDRQIAGEALREYRGAQAYVLEPRPEIRPIETLRSIHFRSNGHLFGSLMALPAAA